MKKLFLLIIGIGLVVLFVSYSKKDTLEPLESAIIEQSTEEVAIKETSNDEPTNQELVSDNYYLGGLDAGYMKANYTLSTQDGKNFDTTSELWIVPRGDYFFTIGAGTRKDEKTGTREEISKIIESIQF